MKKVILFFSFAFISIHLFSADIRGKVLHSETKHPLEFVNVTVLNPATQKSAGGALTDEDGNFTIVSVPAGKYTLRISFVGFATATKEITLHAESLNVGEIPLKEDSKILQEIEVTGQGSQMRFEMDKKVFSVDQNIAASGGSATEVLQNIPSVNVDNEGNVSLRNNQNVEVWINGKPSGLTAENRAQVLQQMPAENIESIEIMTNPSAKFSAEGTAGIINLVMKKNKKAGYYGSISAGTMLTNGNKLGYNTGFSLNYNKNKLETYVNIGFRGMSMKGNSYTNRTNFNNGDTTLLTQNQTNTPKFQGLFFRGGVDYHLDAKNTIGVSGFGMLGSRGGSSFTDYTLQNTKKSLLQHYTRDNTQNGNHPGYHIEGYHKIDFDKNSNLITSLNYGGHNMKSDNRYKERRIFPKDTILEISQNSDNINQELEFKSDYTKKINSDDRLELGINSSYETRNSLSEGFDWIANKPLDLYKNDFSSLEIINAAYFTYAKKFNHLTTQVGLRGEHQIRQMKSVPAYIEEYKPKPDFQLFPSVFLAYSLPKNNELQFNYTRRVNRPRGRQINSFRDYSDPNAVSYGNPYLSPEYSSAFELNYLKNWENHSLSSSVYYRYTTDVIQRVSFMKDSLLNSTNFNLTQQQNTGVEFVAKNRLFKFLNLTTSLNMYYDHLNPTVYNPSPDIKVQIKEQENFSWDVKTIANMMFSRTFSAQVTAQYIAPQIIPQGKQLEMYSIDFGLRKTFMDRKLTIAAMGRDIFNTRKVRTVTSGPGFVQNYETIMGPRMSGGRMLGITATYAFGNMKPKKQEREQNQEMNNMDMGD